LRYAKMAVAACPAQCEVIFGASVGSCQPEALDEPLRYVKMAVAACPAQ
jgi:hypothetical protein